MCDKKILPFNIFTLILRNDISDNIYIKEIFFIIYEYYFDHCMIDYKWDLHFSIETSIIIYVLNKSEETYFYKNFIGDSNFYSIFYDVKFLNLLRIYSNKEYQGMNVAGNYHFMLDYLYEYHPHIGMIYVSRNIVSMSYKYENNAIDFNVPGAFLLFNEYFDRC